MFTEGHTEEGYLLHWRRQFRDVVNVTVDAFHGTPLQLVQHAVDSKRREATDARKGRGRAHDEVWCVFDRDEHPNIDQALEQARANDVQIALSDPCIELWFLLHFTEHTAHVERDSAQRRVRELLSCGKRLSNEALQKLAARYGDARRRAQALDAKHEGDGSPRFSNPNSNLWELVDRLQDAPNSRRRPS